MPKGGGDDEAATTWKHAGGMVGVWIVCLFGNMYSMAFANRRLRLQLPPVSHPPLPDVGHDWIPKIGEGYNDTLLGIVVAMCALVCVFGGKHRWPMLFRYAAAYSVLLLLRSATVAATALPATDNHCQKPQAIEHPFQNAVAGMVTGGASSIHCGDLMFSGHTIALVLSVMVVFTYQPYTILKVLSLVLLLLAVYSIIATRSHYTVDVIVGLYVSWTTWHLTPPTWPALVALASPAFPSCLRRKPTGMEYVEELQSIPCAGDLPASAEDPSMESPGY
ncbi:Phosphatidylinositol:ceramide inositolphosphotransferase [Diplonema papillatum]|nr:Phosphatidylinositol:ceramide inositolphosphotransferase [Diplonema papillatum]